MARVGVWLSAIRLPTLLTGLAPVVVGNALGWHAAESGGPGLHLTLTIATVFAVVLLQIAANLVNDAKDAARGVDNQERLGPRRAVASGLLTIVEVRHAYRLCLFAALALGAALAVYGGVAVLLVALVCAAVAYLYTGGPFPLAYYGLGELAALIFFGPVAVAGCFYLHTLSWSFGSVIWGLAPGFMAAAVMAINNFRDRHSDRKAGKRTLATSLPVNAARWLPAACVVAATVVVLIYGFQSQKETASLLSMSGFLAIASRGLFPLLRQDGFMLNLALKRTSLLNFVAAVLFAVVVLW